MGSGWQIGAICAQTDPELFFPQKGINNRIAKRLCRRCPIQADCLKASLDGEEEYGVWGGAGKRDRLLMLREIHGPNYVWPSRRLNIGKCRKGHDTSTPESLILQGDGYLRCKACHDDYNAQRNAKRKAKRKAEKYNTDRREKRKTS